MEGERSALLLSPRVREALRSAWLDSRPGQSGGHEEGGFIIRNERGRLRVIRWPRGRSSTIQVPSHSGCTWNGNPILASFHTHPNTGRDFLQEPSLTDMRAVADDPDLKGSDYIGEYVISDEWIYRISPSGEVSQVGLTQEILH